MRKMIYSMMTSLDGFIERKHSEEAVPKEPSLLDWVIIDEELHSFANEEARAAGAFLYGRRLYENMAAFWPTADTLPDMPGLIDEIRLIVHPVVLGSGTPCFPPVPNTINSRLLETQTFGSGVVYLPAL